VPAAQEAEYLVPGECLIAVAEGPK